MQAAGWVHVILYTIFIRAGEPRPLPGSLRFARHRRQLLIAIYVLYFVFTVYEVDFNLQKSQTAYHELGVPLGVDESGIQSRFRKLTVKFHPDKARLRDRQRATDYYVHLKQMRDILLDPAKRFAYERLGLEGLARCERCITVKDFVDNALLTAVGTYSALLVILLCTNALGFLKEGAYWRYLAIVAVATFDVRTAMRPDYSSLLTNYINPFLVYTHLRPPYLPFQLALVVKKASISAAQFLGLLIPLYRLDPQVSAPTAADTDEERHKQIDRLESLTRLSLMDSTRLLELEAVAFRGNEHAKTELREALKKYMVQNVVHQEKDVRDAMGQSLRKRRGDAPPGAVGTK